MTTNEVLEGQSETFLEMLYHCEERHDIPVVDESFVQQFSSLSEEDQYKAMGHILFLTMTTADGLRNQVYQKRLSELYKAWFDDQTETWVIHTYDPPVERAYWDRELAERKARQAAEEEIRSQTFMSTEEVEKELGL